MEAEASQTTDTATEAQAESYDVVVVGTGLPESIVAAALARIGKKVLHVDRNEFYGGENTVAHSNPELNPGETLFSLCGSDKTCSQITQKIHTLLEPTPIPRSPTPNVQVSAQATLTENNDGTVNENGSEKKDGAEGSAESTSEGKGEDATEGSDNTSAQEKPVEKKPEAAKKEDEKKEVTFADLLKEGRRFNLDLRAQLLWSKGDLVQLLISSRVGKYLEFRAIEATHLMTKKGLEQVPCSKADVFVSKVVSPVEKRFLMKFLGTCAEHGAEAEMIGEFQGRPFGDFMKHHKLSANVQQFVVYAIAMVQDDVMKGASILSTEEGLKLTQRFLQSLGAYGKTPFLFPAYGCAEMAQAFCRLCAVYGGVYMLRRTPTALLCQTGEEGKAEATGVVFGDGEVVRAKQVVVGPSYVCDSKERHVSRGIFITDGPLATTNQREEIDISVSVIPPGFSGNIFSVTVVQLGPKSFAAPKNKYGDNTNKPRVLYSLFFRQSYSSTPTPALPSHVQVCGGCDWEVDCDGAVRMAKATFEAIYPGEEWLPAAIDPEEIDWVASQPQQKTEGEGAKSEKDAEKDEEGEMKGTGEGAKEGDGEKKEEGDGMTGEEVKAEVEATKEEESQIEEKPGEESV